MSKEFETPFETFDIIAEVKSVQGLEGGDTGGKGPCRYYEPGDKIVFREGRIEGTICYSALASMMYKILAMRLGFTYPWAKDGVVEHACPDAARPVVFKVYRAEGESGDS
ncbi:MAG: TIGR04076 family protein [Candidatus Thorarchaeota archaeon]